MLLLHQPAAAVQAGIDAAVAMGRFDSDLIAVEARRLAPARNIAPVAVPATAPQAALHERPAPALGAYDRLLGVGA